jgi:hypothetical protein
MGSRWHVGVCGASLAAVLACHPPVHRLTSRSTLPDTNVIDLGRPTLVAYFVTTQARADSDPDVAEALADFQHSLDNVRDTLEKRGIQVVETYRDSIRFRWPTGKIGTYLTADSDSPPVGYHFFATGQTPVTQVGVLTDIDLLQAVAKQFSWRP